MPFPLFYKLQIFDTYLEPQSPFLDDLYQARMAYFMFLTSPNATSKNTKNLKPSQFLLNDPNETVFKTREQLEEIARKKEEERKASLLSMFDPELLGQLKSGQVK